MKSHLRFTLSLALALALPSCATIFNRPQKLVNITSTPAGASVRVTNSAGALVHTGSTPTVATLAASRGYFRGEKYTIEFSGKGGKHTATLDARVSGWYFGNLALGGLVGMLVVDPLSGSMWTLDTEVSAQLGTAQADAGTLRIIHRADVPTEQAHRLVALN